MHRQIAEADWKIFRRLREVALDRFCQRVLSEVSGLLSATDQTNHQRYLALFKVLHEGDDELAGAFNDLRRSTAYQQLAIICSLGVLTDQEIASFSEETRNVVDLYRGK
jgi:hypothetical protein